MILLHNKIRLIFKLGIILLVISLFNKPILAYDSSRPNNKFGIHLAQPHLNEIKKVAELVNGNGGDWGYVTLVMQENDRGHQKWQEIFDLLREFHLIPIIRLGTMPVGENWKRPSKDDAQSWADFLDSLNWVVKNRYIILFNEPNHGSEWGGEVDVVQYSEVAKEFAKKLKDKNPDFFVMLAGLDASAPSYATTYLDEEKFLRDTINNISVEQFNNLFSGFASHSYPNPGFSGSPNDYGRKSIHAYQWELEILKSMGVKNDFPVFITETGWSTARLSHETVAQYMQSAFLDWGNDSRIIAVTPFVYDYQSQPFLEFSWKKFQSEDFYPQYYTVQSMKKIKGEPEQIDKGTMKIEYGPYQLVANSNYRFYIKLKNTGQNIWSKEDGYKLSITSDAKELPFEYLLSDLAKIKPFQEAETDLIIKTKTVSGKYKITIELLKNKQVITQIKNINMEIVPLPNLDFQTNLYPKLQTEGGNFEIQIFDEKEGLVFKRSGITVRKGWGVIDALQNIVIGKKYRIVLLRPYYLPRQDYVSFKRGSNILKFKRMYPLDFNKDGHFDWSDFGALLKNPELVSLLFP